MYRPQHCTVKHPTRDDSGEEEQEELYSECSPARVGVDGCKAPRPPSCRNCIPSKYYGCFSTISCPCPTPPYPPRPSPPVNAATVEMVARQAQNTSIMILPNSIRIYYEEDSNVAYLPWIPFSGSARVQIRTETTVTDAGIRMIATDETSNVVLLSATITSSGFQVFDMVLPAQPSRISVTLAKMGSGTDPIMYGMMYTVPVTTTV